MPLFKTILPRALSTSVLLACCGLILAGLHLFALPLTFAEETGASVTADQQSAGESSPESFTFRTVEDLARKLAGQKYDDSGSRAPFFLDMSDNEWQSIVLKKNSVLWHDENLPFEVQFFHPGFIYQQLVSLYIVDQGVSEQIPFNADMFEYGDSQLEEKARRVPLDFAGFRLHFPINSSDYKDELLVFLGGTHFRAVGRHSRYGLLARGVALNTALPEGEEFPYFRKFWLVKPEPDATSITIYALMDSPSMTGAFCFVVHPGTSTIMDVKSVFFQRDGASLPGKIGLAPLGSMYLFSEKESGAHNDYRPEVHDSDALLFAGGNGNWFRRPLSNPERLTINVFDLNSPTGFGLIQQDDNFDHYQDIGARFDRRPSLWVEPTGDWGNGRLELIEIPSNEDVNDNILAFWVPERSPAAFFKAATPDDPASASVDYRLYWMTPNVLPHQLGRVVATRMVRSPENGVAQFIIDFEGEELKDLPAETGLAGFVETPFEYPVLEKQLFKNPITGGWRLQFKIRLPKRGGFIQSLFSALETQKFIRIQAFLKKGDNVPDQLTEVWMYDLPL